MASTQNAGGGAMRLERTLSTAAEQYVAKELLQSLRSNGETDWEQVELSDDECEAAVVAAVNATVTPTSDLSDSGNSWVNLSDSLTLEEGPSEFDHGELKPPGPTVALSVPRGLHIAVLVCGTRGDVQPFIFIAQRLQQDGHRVRLATHALFRDFVEQAGLEFWSLAGDPHKLSAHMVETGGRLLPLSAEEVKAVPEKQQMLEDIMRSTLPACIGNEDEAATGGSAAGAVPFRAQAIISNPVTYGHIHVAEYLDVPLHLMFPQPWCPTTFFPHPLSSVHNHRYYFENSAVTNGSAEGGGGMKGMAYDAQLTNLLSYQIADEFVWLGTKHSVNAFRTDLQTRLRAELVAKEERLASMATPSSIPDPLWATTPFLDSVQAKALSINSLEKIRAGENGANLLNSLRVPFAKMWSPSFVPRPPDWGEHIDIIGNIFPPLPPPDGSVGGYVAPSELLEWLAETTEDGAPDPPVFIGFGSMIIKDPTRLLAIIEAAALETGTRVLLQSSWTNLQGCENTAGGKSVPRQRRRKRDILRSALGMKSNSGTDENNEFDKNGEDKDDFIDDAKDDSENKDKASSDVADDTSDLGRRRKLVFHCGAVPHEWLFPRVSAVIHHGGAGTVAAGLRAGKPTLICPFFGDQYFWARAVHRAGVGVNLGHISRLNVAKLSAGLKITNPSVSTKMAAKAKALAARFELEDGAYNAVQSFYRHLPLDSMACDVCIWLPHDHQFHKETPPLASVTLSLNPKRRYDAAHPLLCAHLRELDRTIGEACDSRGEESSDAEVDRENSALKISEAVFQVVVRRQRMVKTYDSPTSALATDLVLHGRSIDSIDLAREASVYRGACAWGNPPPENFGAGLYQGSVGFLAKSSSALKHAFVQPFSTAFEAGRDSTGNKVLDSLGGFVKGAAEGLPASGRKFQSAFSTFAKKSFKGARQQHGPATSRRPRERNLMVGTSSQMPLGHIKDPPHDTSKAAAGLGVPADDVAVWTAFDAAIAVRLGWQKHLGHDRLAAASEEDSILALILELGYEFTKDSLSTSTTTSGTAPNAIGSVLTLLHAQWTAGLEVSQQEFSAALASTAGTPPAARLVCQRCR